jgi:uncharacterized protein
MINDFIQALGVAPFIFRAPHQPYPYYGGVTGTVRRKEPKIGRNEPCPCGSGKKYKKCCLEKGGDIP